MHKNSAISVKQATIGGVFTRQIGEGQLSLFIQKVLYDKDES
jgi:hypothetical protein